MERQPTGKQMRIAQKYKLPPCIYQVSAGDEFPCCDIRWAWVLNTTKRITALEAARKRTGVGTICEPYDMGEACEEGIVESR